MRSSSQNDMSATGKYVYADIFASRFNRWGSRTVNISATFFCAANERVLGNKVGVARHCIHCYARWARRSDLMEPLPRSSRPSIAMVGYRITSRRASSPFWNVSTTSAGRFLMSTCIASAGTAAGISTFCGIISTVRFVNSPPVIGASRGLYQQEKQLSEQQVCPTTARPWLSALVGEAKIYAAACILRFYPFFFYLYLYILPFYEIVSITLRNSFL